MKQWSWENDQTGNGGIVLLKNSFNHEGMLCRRIEQQLKFRGQSDVRRFHLSYCRVGEQEWKILAEN